MSRNLVVTIVVVLLLIVGGWFLTRSKQPTNPSPQTTQQTPASTGSASPSATGGAMMAEKNVINISATGFTPQTLTIKAGDTVTWVNGDSADHTVNSDSHPTHTLFPILNKVGLIKPGEKKSLQFTTTGTYQYHDHLNPSLTGSITVQ